MNLFLTAILFGLALASVQAWLMGLRLLSLRGILWLGINAIGPVVAFFIASSSLYPVVRSLRLDVLQNGWHAAIAIGIAIAIFGIIMTILQWSVLRRRVNAPLGRALANTTVGTTVWFGLIGLFPRTSTGDFSPFLPVLALLLGAGLGAALERGITRLMAALASGNQPSSFSSKD